MRDRGLHEKILGLPAPWHVEDVELREDACEVIVTVGLRRPLELACPDCGEAMDGYDYRRRSWRHLDTGQYKTIIVAEAPRGECPTHGVRQIEVPWAKERSRFTALFEALAIWMAPGNCWSARFQVQGRRRPTRRGGEQPLLPSIFPASLS